MSDYVLNNRYRLLAQIASGGMAVVYKAHDLTLNRVVAIKILRENFADNTDFRARFQNEAQAAANLAHPNIVTVYDFGQDGNRSYIVMEYVEGRDLKNVIRAEAPLAIDRAIDLMAQACAALGYAHRAGLVHCDVKPQNMLVTSDGRLKVTDFGIARALSQSVPTSDTVWGTPHYFSPEQAAGEPPTPASDVYSLGVVMYEMLAGQLPFDADNHTDLAMQHLRDEPPPLAVLNPAVPIQIEQIVNRVMAKEPAARYRTAEQFGRALMDYRRLADQMTGMQPAASITTEPTTVSARPIEPAAPQGTDWLAWILGTLAVVAVIGLIPLAVLVARAYSQPLTPNATPTPPAGPTTTGEATLPPFAEEVLVPNLLNRTKAEAMQAASAQNLQIVEGPGRYDAQIPAGSVVAQEPAFGKKVARGAVITINLSQGPRISQMVNVLNFTYEEVISGLLTYGWTVNLVEQYNPQAQYHQILKQEPVAGLPLAAGQPVTLTVSGGTTLTLQVNLSEQIWLDAANLPNDQIKRGQMVDLTLFWRGQKKVNTPYSVFVHLINSNGKLVQQIDTEPGAGTLPTPAWTPGITVTDRYEMEVPANLPPGEYQLRVGMYPTGQPLNRLPVTDPGKAEVDGNSILIRRITILP